MREEGEENAGWLSNKKASMSRPSLHLRRSTRGPAEADGPGGSVRFTSQPMQDGPARAGGWPSGAGGSRARACRCHSSTELALNARALQVHAFTHPAAERIRGAPMPPLRAGWARDAALHLQHQRCRRAGAGDQHPRSRPLSPNPQTPRAETPLHTSLVPLLSTLRCSF